jgi:hypothetical protein
MARDVKADVEVEDKSGRGLTSFLAGLRKMSGAAKDAQRDADRVTTATDKWGRKTSDTARAHEKLTRELQISRNELGSLARAFADAGTAAERLDISKVIRKQKAEISGLSKNADILKDLLPDQRQFTKEVSSLFSTAASESTPIIAGVIAAFAPQIAATLSGAIIGGAGLGGILGGVIVAAQDQRVQAAAKGMAGEIRDELQDAAVPFVKTTIDGIDEIGAAVKGVDFKSIFADASSQAGPVIDGVAHAVTVLGGAFKNLVHEAGPALTAIGDGVGEIGDAVAQGLNSLADNGQEGASALRQLFIVVSGGVQVTFALVNALTETYGWLQKVGGRGIVDGLAAGQEAVGHFTKVGQDASSSMAGFQRATDDAAVAAASATEPVATFTATVDDLASSGRSLFDATTNVGEAIDRVAAAAKHSKAGLDANTEAGRANRAALSNLADTLVAEYDATVKVNGEGVRSNSVAASNRSQFVKLASQFTKTKGQAEALATSMGLIKPKKNIDFTANTHDAAARIQALKEQIGSVHGKTVTIDVKSRINKVQNTIDRLGGNFDATSRFAFARPDAPQVMSVRDRPVQVDSQVDVSVLLDGKPLRDYVDKRVSQAVTNASYRQKVGRR